MSAHRFTSRGGKKEKYIPMKDHPKSNVIPLCDQPEAQPYLMTVESMLEKSTATLKDSIWARPNTTPLARQTPRQPSRTAQKMPSAIKIETSSPTAWDIEAPNSPGVGRVGSRWAVQAPQIANPKPERLTSINIVAKPDAQTTFVPHHLRGNEPSSYIPPHLRGIDPTKVDEVPRPVVRTTFPTSAVPIPDSAPVPRPSDNPEGEEWARKMGLLPVSTPAPVPRPSGNPEGEEWARKMGLLPASGLAKQIPIKAQNNVPKAQNYSSSQIQRTKTSAPAQNIPPRLTKAYDNERFHLKQDSTEQFQQYVQKSGAAINGKKYTFNAPAAQEYSNDIKVENRALFGKPDPHAMFNPNQIAASNTKSGKVVIRENVPVNKVGSRWPTHPAAEAKFMNDKATHKKIYRELETAVPLTQGALVEATGFMPRDHNVTFEVSDDGVVEQTKEGIRATQGIDAATQLLDWDRKRWAPPPCDWENDRAGFDDSFIPEYIKEWRAEVVCGPSVQVDTTCDNFVLGKRPIDNDILDEPVEQPECTPDIANSCDEMKRLHQTAIVDANNYLARLEKKQRSAEKHKAYSQARHLEIAMAVDEPNPFSPKIDMYVRPVQEKDADAIMKIYNHYVTTSIMPEDQEPITTEDAVYLVRNSKNEKLPFVVAVKGRLPPKLDAQGRPRPGKAIQPQVENVIGFAFAERFNYAFNGTVKGRSRGTACIQLYVHPEHTRKGVGRNTLDQLLHCMATAYTFKNGCPWINPESDLVHEPNGCGLIHQMIMQVPVLKKNDPTFPWLSKFLYNKFWFKEENRLKSVARSSMNQGAAYFLDLAILQCELLHEAEFDAFN